MVLESMFNFFVLKRRPWNLFFAGFLYSIVGLFLSYLIFREVAGLLTVFLIVIAALPLLYVVVKNEEDLDIKSSQELSLLKEHSKAILSMLFLFFGITTALVFAYVILPQEVVHTIFSLQENAIQNVNNYVQGNITKMDIFVKIFTNNLKVLFFCLLFSLLYGTGAIFVLTWNASVIAVAIGSLLKTELGKTAALVGLSKVSSYFGAATFSFFRYMSHGILEIIAYFIMGLAGSIISIAIMKHDIGDDRVVTDILDLVLISLGFLLVAGVIEVYVTPILFS
ncbi:MAG: stage II sporulation protein M [Nanoarchaeota archaeon]